ncbi:MAG: FUSC family protein [Actinomycetota bacterium]|nr:FUSC family protein [Actinomycetota bacterium]
MTDDATPAKPLTRRLTSAAATLGVVLVVPVVLAFLVAGPPAAGGAALGSLFGFLLALMTGLRRAAAFLVPILLAASLAAMLVDTVWWVAGLGLIGLLMGVLSSRGLLLPMAMMGVAWSVSRPTDPASDLVVVMVFAAVSGVYAIAIARRLGVPRDVDQPRVATSRATLMGVGLGLAAVLAGFATQNWDDDNSYWLPMTIFILGIPAPGVGLTQRAVTRVLGTAVGVAVAVTIAVVVDVALVGYVLAFTAMVVVLAVPTPRWFNAACVSGAIVLALSPTSESVAIGGSRIGATALAAVIVLAVGGVLALVAWLMPTSPGQEAQLDDFEEELERDSEPSA